MKNFFSVFDIIIGILPANSWMICRHPPHGVAPSVVTTAKARNSLYPCDRAEKIATLSAHSVVGYAFDSILKPGIILLSDVRTTAPTA